MKWGFSDIVRFTYDVFVAYMWYAYRVTLVPTAHGKRVLMIDRKYFSYIYQALPLYPAKLKRILVVKVQYYLPPVVSQLYTLIKKENVKDR